MIFGSCHFLCHQFTGRDEPNQIMADMGPLFKEAALRRELPVSEKHETGPAIEAAPVLYSGFCGADPMPVSPVDLHFAS